MDKTLGEKIHIESKLVRRQTQKVNAHSLYPTKYVYKYWAEVPFERDGIIVGIRTLQNGKRGLDGEHGYYFAAEEYIKVLLVAYSLREKPVHVPFNGTIGASH